MLLVRHGQSEFNAIFGLTRIDPGIEDPHLTDRGREQARLAAEELVATGVRRLITSPYQRTLQTASVIAETLSLPITVEPLIRERYHFTCDIGTPASQLAADWPTLDFSGLNDRWWLPENQQESEPEYDVQTRCRAFLEKWPPQAALGNACLVTHWGFIRALSGLEVTNGAIVRAFGDGDGEVVHPGYP